MFFEKTDRGHSAAVIQALWQAEGGEPLMQVRAVVRGSETVLGDAASSDELFVSTRICTRRAASQQLPILPVPQHASFARADAHEALQKIVRFDVRKERKQPVYDGPSFVKSPHLWKPSLITEALLE